MRKVQICLIAAATAFGGASAASACDLEGFGFMRVNPFGQQASFGIPAAKPPHQESRNTNVLAAQQRDNARLADEQDAARRADTDQQPATIASKAFVASAVAPAEQTRRFTATKD